MAGILASRISYQKNLLLSRPFKVCQDLQRISLAHYMSGIGVRRSLPRNTIIKFVPQQEAWIVERFGKYHSTLLPGLNFLMPVVDEVKYVQSLKEIASEVPQQSAITRDNVTLHLDGVLYFRVVDPYKSSYGVEDPQFAITQLAQTTMRSEIDSLPRMPAFPILKLAKENWKIALDDVFRERDTLNHSIVESINNASDVWGIRCMRYEIRDIQLPSKVRESMQMQVEAERKKRAAVLESEGQRESAINRANGEAQAILAKAKARAEAIDMVSKALNQVAGNQAAALSIAEQYIGAFSNLAKKSNTIILPANSGDVSSMVAQALAVYGSITKSLPNEERVDEEDDPDSTPPVAGKTAPDTQADTNTGSANLSGREENEKFGKTEHFSVLSSPTRKRDFVGE